MKGSVDYHRRVDFRALDVFVHAVKSASRDELKGAVKTASEMSKDLAINSNERPIWKRLATLLRAELKGYAKNPRKKNPDKNVNHDWYVEGMVRAQRQADYGKLNSLKADLRKMGKAQSDAIMADFRAGYKAWYDAQRAGGVVVRGGVHARKNNPEIEIRELILWAENDSKLSNQFMSIMKNLSRKHKKGTYDPVLAAKLWKYWIDEAVKNYNREVLGGGYSLKQNVFTVQDRKDAAIEVEEQWRDDVRGGEYLTFSNPSHRKKKKKKVTRKRNPKKEWIGFKIKGKDVRFLVNRGGKFGFSLTKGEAIPYATKKAANDAISRASRAVSPSWDIGIAPRGTEAHMIWLALNNPPGKARRPNPVGPTQTEVDKAQDLFRDFTGEHPEKMKSVKLPVPKTGLVIGELDGVLYTTVRDGKTEAYKHDFKKGSRPLLASSHDGSSLHILGGEYEFTERGIEDK